MSAPAPKNRRILVVDDNPSIHEDFRRMMQVDAGADELDAAAASLFGEAAAPSAAIEPFQLSSALQGQQALEMVASAFAAGAPYALAFVDMRMPPGWDGLTTIQKLWEVDPDLTVVLCTAYSDHSWEEIRATLREHKRWLVLKKPFEKIEALQMASAMTERWNLIQQAKRRIADLEAALAGAGCRA